MNTLTKILVGLVFFNFLVIVPLAFILGPKKGHKDDH